MKKLLLLIAVLLLCLPMALGAENTVVIEKKTYDASLEELNLKNVKIKDIEALEKALANMPNLKYVDMSYCGLKYEKLAELREKWKQEGVKIVWTVTMGPHTCKTDATAFSTLNDSNATRYGEKTYDPLKYCTELRALDLGHNWIFDISFIEPMTELRVLVLSDNRITDISVLEGKPLEYLEMFNNRTKDISCLKDCTTLIDVNLCNTHVGDLSILRDLPNLKRVWMGDIDELTKKEINAFLEVKGDSLEAYNFTTKYPTMYGWRENERYEIIKAMFKEGVYMDFNTVLRPDQYVYLHGKK